ncbi:MAG: hypothetical protein ACN4GZ_06285 [Acidimicrobiales bacterium]
MASPRLFIAFVAALGAVSCSASGESASTIPFGVDESVPEVAPTVPDTLIAEPEVTLEPAIEELVIVHAAWLCELQRRTFTDPGDIEPAQEEHLARSGTSAEDYRRFLSDLAARQDFRDAVLFEYQSSCLRD